MNGWRKMRQVPQDVNKNGDASFLATVRVFKSISPAAWEQLGKNRIRGKTGGGKWAKQTPMSEGDEEKKDGRDEILTQAYAKTRKSLIARLENWEDQRTWDEFYQTYWRLIYSVAIKSGLRQDEAFDCVQETILSIAKQSKKNLYDPEQGSFKTWLMNMTRWRINDQFRRRKKDTAMLEAAWESDRKTSAIDRVEDPAGEVLPRLWETEWKKNLADAALARVKAQVSPKQYQIFDCYVIKQWDAREVQEKLNVSMAQVYLAKHRVGAVLKHELAKLEDEDDVG
jgi:RNA polymerase sigma-70 factor (ECF subfamily)